MSIEKVAVIGFVIREVTLLVLIGFLCWVFHNGWPCLLIMLAGNMHYGNDGKGGEPHV